MAGRWKSDVFMRYIRLSVNTHEFIASTIFAFESMTFNDVRRVAPGSAEVHPIEQERGSGGPLPDNHVA